MLLFPKGNTETLLQPLWLTNERRMSLHLDLGGVYNLLWRGWEGGVGTHIWLRTHSNKS